MKGNASEHQVGCWASIRDGSEAAAQGVGRMPKQERWDGWDGGAGARAHLQQCSVSLPMCCAQSG